MRLISAGSLVRAQPGPFLISDFRFAILVAARSRRLLAQDLLNRRTDRTRARGSGFQNPAQQSKKGGRKQREPPSLAECGSEPMLLRGRSQSPIKHGNDKNIEKDFGQ